MALELLRPSGGSPRTPLGRRKTSIPHGEDLYDSVVLAAFGGMELVLFRESEARQIHPLVPFFFVCGLFIIQSFLVLETALDLDLDAKVRNDDQGDLVANTVLTVEKVLIVLAQISFYHRIFSSIRCFFFVLNPVTWQDMKRPRGEWIWSPCILAPLCFVSLFWKCFMQIEVASLSVSIIFSNAHVESAVFDCLAIVFIAELDQLALRFVKITFYIEVDHNIKFKMRRNAQAKEPICNLPEEWIWSRWMLCKLRTGQGGRRTEAIFAGIILFGIYLYQFQAVMLALETNELPATRSLCRRWNHLREYNTGLYACIQSYFFHRWLSMVAILKDTKPDVEEYARGICEDKAYDAASIFNLDIIQRYPREASTFFMVMLFLLLVPPCLQCLDNVDLSLWGLFHKKSNEDDDDDASPASVEGELPGYMHEKLDDIEDENIKDVMLHLFSGQIQNVESKPHTERLED